MNSSESFLQAIREAPDDDVPRLQYADWLDEQGDPRGEFIRLQIEKEKWPDWHPRRHQMDMRARELFDQHHEQWNQEVPERCRNQLFYEMYQRGFPEVITMSLRDFVDHGDEMIGQTPARSLRLLDTAGVQDNDIRRCPHWQDIRNLIVGEAAYNINPNPTSLIRAALPRMKRLTSLDIRTDNFVDDDLVRLLRMRDSMHRLTHLSLDGTRLGVGLLPLASTRQLHHLPSLTLCGNILDADVAPEFFRRLRLSHLSTLDVSYCRMEDHELEFLSELPALSTLATLDLSRNDFTADGVNALASSPNLASLRHLVVRDSLNPEGAAALGRSTRLSSLEAIDFTYRNERRPSLEKAFLTSLGEQRRNGVNALPKLAYVSGIPLAELARERGIEVPDPPPAQGCTVVEVQEHPRRGQHPPPGRGTA